LKLDGYRAVAFKRNGTVHLRPRNDNDFAVRYPAVVMGLAKLPNDTIIDGEVVAFDEEGRPSFNVLQNFGSAPAPVVYYVFDVMMLRGRMYAGSRWRSVARCSNRGFCPSSRTPSITRPRSKPTCRR
jgi:ATP-dependent DNA ligase